MALRAARCWNAWLSPLMSAPRVAAIGLASWDRFIVTDFYPPAGSYAIVRQTLEQSGGTTANMAHALAKLGVNVTLTAKIGDDVEGRTLRQVLESTGCDCRYVETRVDEPSDSAIIVVSGQSADLDRTIFWHQGARLRHGDLVPVNELFAHDLVIVDVDDARLRRFIVDLPIHVSPRTRLLGTMTYLVEESPAEALELALRHDFLVGNQRELCYITGASETDDAVRLLQARMVHTDTRLAAVSLGANGCLTVTQETIEHVPAFDVDAVDTTGAGDAFAAGMALGILERKSLREIGILANAMGALTIRQLGARSALPSRAELDAFLAAQLSPERLSS
jgi:sugar/nucleoside kinase (ribokinase family)